MQIINYCGCEDLKLTNMFFGESIACGGDKGELCPLKGVMNRKLMKKDLMLEGEGVQEVHLGNVYGGTVDQDNDSVF